MANDTADVNSSTVSVSHAKTMLQQLFEVMEIKRVYIIDDELSMGLDVSDVIGAIASKVNTNQINSLATIDWIY